MAITTTVSSRRSQPHDRHAERVVIGASLHHWRHHDATRAIVAPADFWFPQHQALYAALDDLHDVGPYPYGTHDEWAAMWPQTPFSSLEVRVAAAWTLAAMNARIDVPLWALHRIADCADGTHEAAARAVKARAADRADLVALARRFDELSGAS